MILFLDFDGVLHPKGCDINLFFCKAPHLWRLLDNVPELNIVFSTSWRINYSLDELVEMLCHAPGNECYRHRFIGVTPVIKLEQRGDECMQWLIDHNMEKVRHLAVDDCEDWFADGCYAIDSHIGISSVDVENIFNYFSARNGCDCQF